MKKTLTIFFILLFTNLFSQSENWKIYNSLNSPLPNNKIVQTIIDNNNVMYFASHEGLIVFDGLTWKKFNKENYDYLIIDTAGRLSNNTNLVNQLVKLKNVVSKINTETIIETVLVLDGTNGSNMIKQVEIFGKELNISSIIITKLDGTAKGGALISIANKYEIPISYVGLGEKPEDLSVFSAKNFARSILNLEE